MSIDVQMGGVKGHSRFCIYSNCTYKACIGTLEELRNWWWNSPGKELVVEELTGRADVRRSPAG